MVSYNRILSKDWFNPKPVIRSSLQWHQSQRFKPWEKPIQNCLEDYEMRYSLKNGTTNIVPKSSQRKKLSHEGKTTLKENLKEIEAFNSSSDTCFGSAPNKRNKNRGEDVYKIARPLYDERLKYPERVHVKTDYMVEGSDEQNWDKIWYVGSAYKRHMSPIKSLFKRLKDNFRMLDIEEDERKFIFSYGVGEAHRCLFFFCNMV
ncbi:hypothetical protein Tco_1251382 [Tanacetum coccineum]